MTSRPSRVDTGADTEAAQGPSPLTQRPSGSADSGSSQGGLGKADARKRRTGSGLPTALAGLSWTQLLVLAAMALLIAETGVEYYYARLATRRLRAGTGEGEGGGGGGGAPWGHFGGAGGGAGDGAGSKFGIRGPRGSSRGPDLVDAFAGAPRTYDGAALEELPRGQLSSMRLFVFQPSGGFNNQRIIVERAVRICGVLGRVCVVPMAGRHSSLFANYNKLGEDDLMSMDRVLDFAALAGAAQVVPTRLPFLKLLAHLRKRIPDKADWHVLEQSKADKKKQPLLLENLTAWRDAPERVWYFAGPTMWQRFGEHATHFERPVWPHVHYSGFFRALAIDMAGSLGLVRNYVAVHARQSDHGEKWEKRMAEREKEKEAEAEAVFAAEADAKPVQGRAGAGALPGKTAKAAKAATTKFAHSKGFSTRYIQSEEALSDPGTYLGQQIRYSLVHRSLPREHLMKVYIATKPGSNLTHFANLTRKFDYTVLFSGDVPRRLHDKLRAALPRPEQDRLRADMLGVVEQLVCARAYVFIGFRGSSFSEQIGRLRREPLRNLEVTEFA